MRLHRFFVTKTIDGDKYLINEERLIHQWRNVFRYNTGSEAILFDGSGFEYYAVINKLDNREAELVILEKKKGVVPKIKISIYQAMVKKDKAEWIAEKATELGVSSINFFVSDRSEKKNINLERLRKIVLEASEQCGRADVPEINNLERLEVGMFKTEEEIIVFDKSGEPISFFNQNIEHLGPVSIFIGPEGGWTDDELQFFKKQKARVFSLGPLTLRSETAATLAVAAAAGRSALPPVL